MKAVVIRRFGDLPDMSVEERDRPEPRDGHSLVRLHAATINQLSNRIREGGHPLAHAPLVPRNEGSGVIEESARFSPGTRVIVYCGGVLGITEDGLYWQWAVVDDRRLVELPDALTFDEGAALSVNYLTAYRTLTQTVRPEAGQKFIVSGATGSVGHALMQTARALGGDPIALTSTAAKAERARQAGATIAIDLSSHELPDAVRALTGGQGVEIGIDPVGGPVFGAMLRALRERGTLVSIGFTGGNEPGLDLFTLIAGQKRIVGYSIHGERDEDLVTPLREVINLATKGVLKPAIDTVVDLDHFEDGYARLASHNAMGSIIVRL